MTSSNQDNPGSEESPDFAAIRAVLDTLPVGAYTCDADGLITYYNEPAVKAWGRAPAIGSPVDRWCGSFRLYHAQTGEPIPHDGCWMALAIKQDQPFLGQEIEIERPDGTRWTALAHANPIRDKQGRMIGAMNILIDVTDTRRASDVLARLASIVESSEDAIYSKTLEGTIQSWNQGAVRLFGYTAREAVGAPITLIVPPEERTSESDILARIRRGELVGNYETVRVAKDGHRLDVSLTVSPIKTIDGRMIGASSIVRDISDRKRQERGIHTILEMSGRLASQLDRQTILDDLARTTALIRDADYAMISLVSSDGTLSPAAQYRMPAELLHALERVMPGEGASGRCLATGERVFIEEVSADPGFAPFLEAARKAEVRTIYSAPLTDANGKVFGVVSTYFRQPPSRARQNPALMDLVIQLGIDFLERARLYNELQENDRSKNRFLAILSHELRNPLAPIRSAVETVHLTASGSPELAAPLSVIDRQITQMARLIDDLLDISRITNNKLNLRKEPVDLAEVVRAAVEASRPILGASDHELGVALPDQPIWIYADPTRIVQVIGNLLNNAAKYTPESGQISLTVETADQQAVIRVRDNGAGIPTEMLAKVFEMFTQVEDAGGRAKGGLGIGLTLAQRLVELHGGSISAESEGPGRGSQFTVRLPVVPAPLQPPASRDQATARPGVQRSANPLRIMIVDDNRDAADSLGALLSLHGHQVRVGYDSLDAIESAGEFHPHVMLLDIGLPGLNGYETAQQVRQQPWGRNLLLIAVTGWGQEEAKRRSWEAGFDSHLVKPVDPTVLVDLLGTLHSARE